MATKAVYVLSLFILSLIFTGIFYLFICNLVLSIYVSICITGILCIQSFFVTERWGSGDDNNTYDIFLIMVPTLTFYMCILLNLYFLPNILISATVSLTLVSMLIYIANLINIEYDKHDTTTIHKLYIKKINKMYYKKKQITYYNRHAINNNYIWDTKVN